MKLSMILVSILFVGCGSDSKPSAVAVDPFAGDLVEDTTDYGDDGALYRGVKAEVSCDGLSCTADIGVVTVSCEAGFMLIRVKSGVRLVQKIVVNLRADTHPYLFFKGPVSRSKTSDMDEAGNVAAFCHE